MLQILMGTTDSANKVRLFRLPKDSKERECWFRIIPRNNKPDTANTSARKRHWSKRFVTLVYYGREKPKDAPYLFDCAKSNMIPNRILAI